MDTDSLIPLIYDAAAEADAWPEVLRHLADSLGVDAAVIGCMPIDALWRGRLWTHGIDPASVSALMQRGVIDRSLYARAALDLPVGQLVDLRRPASGVVPVDDPGVQSMLLPQRLFDGCFGPVLREAGMIAPFACLHGSGREKLDSDALQRLQALMPHLQRAIGLHLRFLRLGGRLELLAAPLQRLAVGVVTVTAELRVLFANAEAEQTIARADGLHLSRGRLVLADPDLQQRLMGAVARMAARRLDGECPYLHVQRPSGAPALTLCVAPAPAVDRTVTARHCAGAATLFVTDPLSLSVLPAPALLADRFGLTATEAEVARLAAMGRGLTFVAETLGVSLNTVRTHLKVVYGKTDVNQQAGLARLIGQSFPPLRAGHDGARSPPAEPRRP